MTIEEVSSPYLDSDGQQALMRIGNLWTDLCEETLQANLIREAFSSSLGGGIKTLGDSFVGKEKPVLFPAGHN